MRISKGLTKHSMHAIVLLHDGMRFTVGRENVKNEYDIIGFYFNHAGFLEPVYRRSIYGSQIMDICREEVS